MFRIGHGFDRHRLEGGRPLRLGGVSVPSDLGTVAHSDGDVLLHATVNAILGALGEGDIGEQFPDTDSRWAGASSSVFVEEAVARLERAGLRLVNLDATVLAERPRLAPLRSSIRAELARLVAAEVSAVNVKFGTGERVGVVGRGEAIEAHVVVLLGSP